MLGTTFIIHRLRYTRVCNVDDDQARPIVWAMMNSRTGHLLRISLSGRECSFVYGNAIRYWFTTDVVIDEDNRIHWSYHDPCPFISDDSICIWSLSSFFHSWIIIWFFSRMCSLQNPCIFCNSFAKCQTSVNDHHWKYRFHYVMIMSSYIERIVEMICFL